MGFVRVSPELGLIFDPMKGVVSEQRPDVVLYTFDPVYERVEKLDKIADDLMNQLVPDNELLSSYANRGKASYIAGLYTNIWMGFIIGLVLSFVILLVMAFNDPATMGIVRKALGGGA
ncbi:MAG: tetrahydromethanopterin S-methyltransferase subunit B [Methanothrix sp.]|jgi:tetrahydromethanopterin S-methyltransferase subunit B|nr:tetrahydromethanopterin S-methyltransferase subunit B [Methanothrix sp.]NMC10223.1 tetrahydromethanopterin S-methyltransferase subunit B [Methanothrix sp.]OPX74807.1 MAG: Tetrahydromethanopterin S-methyltransferase subunit B [Methanosaeta sp. PtaB.Bin018]OPY47994.1 MAG: Tetrahydromethanopterin S-methyltransferase subunit B [Methanosaeta sp. PtaU1.Bin016]HOV51436.1 tetrahydromethanopterin S-methyltransferase subunit B [Methanothrix sp.]